MEDCSVIYLWTARVPSSKHISDIIANSDLADVVTTVCVDCPEVRNILLYGKNPVSSVPCFVIVRGSTCEVYDSTRTTKPLQFVKQLLREISSSGQTIDGLGVFSTRESSKISRIESDDEDGLLRVSKV